MSFVGFNPGEIHGTGDTPWVLFPGSGNGLKYC
jgi:hypothetical protein